MIKFNYGKQKIKENMKNRTIKNDKSVDNEIQPTQDENNNRKKIQHLD